MRYQRNGSALLDRGSITRIVTVLALMLCSVVFGDSGSYVEEVTGVLGGSLTVACRYEGELVQYPHYWCKGASWYHCSIVLQSTGSEKEVTRGRFSLKDNHTTQTVRVTITDLEEEDSGVYWCGTERTGIDNMYQVNVTVSKFHSEVRQTEKPSTTINGMLVTASISANTSTVLQNSVFEEVNTTAVTPGAIHTTTNSASFYLVLQWKVKAVLLGLIPIICIITWRMSKMRNTSLEGEGAQSDE
ncbi:CMRF35-like molecule 7 [Lissotriton helveticus]